MKDQRLEIADIVKHIDDAALGNLNVPEFQRRYVWRPSKVADLVDSLWRGYPVGTLLLWDSAYDSPRTALGNPARKLWIVDGQQRVTSLAILFGKKPYWWDDIEEWNRLFTKYEILVNFTRAKEEMEFGLTNPVRRKSNEWVSVRTILNSSNLSQLAMELAEKLGDTKKFSDVHEKLQSIKRIENAQLYEIIVDHDLEDVAEIFGRLNTAGTKIRESDIVVALVASKQQGWIRQKFDPFLRDLALKGFEFDPGVVIRTLAIVGHGSARLGDVPEIFWQPSDQFDEHWRTTKEAISSVIRNLMDFGVLSDDLLPSLNVLIPIFFLKAKFPNDFQFKRAFYWLLLATRDGRYSGAATTALDQDAKQINSKPNFDEAIGSLVPPLTATADFTAEDFKEDYTDKFLRLILYLLVFNKKAKDWINQDVRIGFDRTDNQLNEGFKPEWHHFFARKILKTRADEASINSLGNIVVLNEKANRAFSSKPPTQYLQDHKVAPERLAEQMVPQEADLHKLEKFEDFLAKRAELLAIEATKLLKVLKEA
jgi:hypothetical protein